MSKDLVVYYATGVSPGMPDTLYEPIGKKALSVMQMDEKTGILQCPAFRENLRNTFCFQNPKEFQLYFEEGKDTRWFLPHYDKNNKDFNINDFIFVRTDKSFSLTYGHCIFWCEEPVELEQLHPSFTYTDLALKTELIFGKFDISKWFRPMDCAYTITEPNTTIDVKRGDPLYFFKLHTDRKVVFKRFKYTKELKELSDICVSTRAVSAGFFSRLKNYYDAVANINISKRVTKAIKKELME